MTGVKVSIGPQRDGGMATRICHARLSWGKQELVVASDASQVDLDAFGVYLDADTPVAAFQIRKEEVECCRTYAIYSLAKPPKLLRTITGGEFFRAADSDLDGRIEIWTEDTEAINGFEGLLPSEMRFVPTCVLRLQGGRLWDVGSEFQSYFDEIIAKVRGEINPERLRDFKLSDGRLGLSNFLSAEQLERMSRLRVVKIQALEIVWAYLYSGREQEAWHSLADLWPAGDVERIRSAILKARDRGIRAQVDDVSAVTVVNRKKPVRVYNESKVTPAQFIMLRLYLSGLDQRRIPEASVPVDLVIDSAGKVRSVGQEGGATWADQYLESSVLEWKFIPAFKGHQPVASRLRTVVHFLR